MNEPLSLHSLSLAAPVAPGIDLSQAAYVHPSVVMYGKIRLSAGVTLWPNVVMRAEMHGIQIGEQSNIQDFVMIHIGGTTPTVVGRDCSITHHCTLHGCKIGDRVLVGIGATLMDGVEVGDNSIIAGGSFLKEGTIIPPNSIVMGSPGKVTKERNNAVANAVNAWLYRENGLAFGRGDYEYMSTPEFHAAMSAERQRLMQEMEAGAFG